ncbi:hypothetical protein [Nocardia sp. 348MFTsu5.1]|uniref:hypothetical protein n=1 Tax=Nocardia sp. 348MFTsu5.1 TaxID=1172185 RepID=UPI000378029B|nr:hypothetical protein [Nocardia sp. 348MFTsu5.1]
MSDKLGDITWSVHVPNPEAWDEAARTATEAGELLLDLRDIELGYASGTKQNPVLAGLLARHQALNTWDDEDFIIRGYLYLIEFDSGWIKTGYTANSPLVRFTSHVTGLYRTHGFKITRIWLSIPVIKPRRMEYELERGARRRSDRTRLKVIDSKCVGESEMHHGLGFDEMVAFARTIPIKPVTPENVVAELSECRKDKYESRVRRRLLAHLQTGGSWKDFELPDVSDFDEPSLSSAPLTDLDFTKRDDLEELLRRGQRGAQREWALTHRPDEIRPIKLTQDWED